MAVELSSSACFFDRLLPAVAIMKNKFENIWLLCFRPLLASLLELLAGLPFVWATADNKKQGSIACLLA